MTEKYEELIPVLGITEVHEMRVQFALKNFSHFHEDLSKTIEWVAVSLMILLSSNSTWHVKLGLGLLETQPDAERWDTVLLQEEYGL